jgi:hypothetical protein
MSKSFSWLTSILTVAAFGTLIWMFGIAMPAPRVFSEEMKEATEVKETREVKEVKPTAAELEDAIRTLLRPENENFEGSSIRGNIRNRSGKVLRYVTVVYHLYDKAGNRVGTARDIVSDLGADETWKFQAYVSGSGAYRAVFQEVTWQ